MNQLTSRQTLRWGATLVMSVLVLLSSAEKTPVHKCCPHGSVIVASPGQKTVCRPDGPTLVGAVDTTTPTQSPPTTSPASTIAATATQTPPTPESSTPASALGSATPESSTPASALGSVTPESSTLAPAPGSATPESSTPAPTPESFTPAPAPESSVSESYPPAPAPESSTHATPNDSTLRMTCAEFYLVDSHEEAHEGRTISVDAKTNELVDSDGLRVPHGEYCAGSIVTMKGPVPAYLVCFERAPATAALAGAIINVLLLVMSAFFLAATLYVYHVAAYTLRTNALDDAIVVSVRYLLAVVLLLGLTNINNLHANYAAGGSTATHSFLCIIIGYPLYWCVLSYFAWLNVVCATSVWATIGRVPYRRWQICARVYTAVTTGLVMTLALRAHTIQVASGLAGPVCWFHSRADQAAFLYAPVGTMLALNVLMCSYIGWHLLRTPSLDTLSSRRWDRLAKQARSVRVRVFMCLRMCLVGGLMWLLELASFMFAQPNPLDTHWIWTIVDTFNYLQGMLVFVVLVLCRNRAMNALADMSFCGRRLTIPKLCTNLSDAEYDEPTRTVVSFVNDRTDEAPERRSEPLVGATVL